MNQLDFFDMLCCPACREDLEHATENRLYCSACDFTFPIVDGIPILFPCDVASQMEDLFARYWDSDENAETYDTMVEGEGEINSIFGVYNHRSEVWALERQYDASKLGFILDAGCGNGRFFETFPDNSVQVGIDASLHLLQRVKKRGRGDFLVCGELEHLPFKDERFDTAISCRVLQHLAEQEKAVIEMMRVLRPRGDLILELYNTWNLKNVYKNIRMSPRLRRIFNAPFRLIFKSMSPFGDWGLEYDAYCNWFQVKGWMRDAGCDSFAGRGTGFGYHKYFLEPFYVNAVLTKYAPAIARWHYSACFVLEKTFGGIPPVRWTMEKIVIKGTKVSQPDQLTDVDSRRSLIRKISAKAEYIIKSSALYNREATRELTRERHQRDVVVADHRRHLVETLDWIRRAQDATPDRGVSRAYGLEWTTYFGRMGWQSSYPETTGYIIPTFFDSAQFLGDKDFRRRAIEMADWEIEVQLPNGAVRGGIMSDSPSPAVFNTGQVILGWLRTHAETGEQRFLDAASRAAAFLLEHQDADGSWNKGNSQYALGSATTYNARVGWALVQYGQAAGDDAAVAAGCRNLDHTLTLQTETGWFRQNCLKDPTAPYTHTISYVLEGLLGGYDVTDDRRYLQAVLKAADGILPAIGSSGKLSGQLDQDWAPKASWVCLTGSCQLAGVFFRLALIDEAGGKAAQYRSAAERLLTFVMGTQNLVTEAPGLRGGIKGSYPVDGAYGRFQLLNWAAKFFVDALLLAEAEIQEKPREVAKTLS